MRTEKETQCDLVISHIKREGSITCSEAVYQYGIMSLPRRIVDLKERGYLFHVEHCHGINKRGKKCYFAKYSLLDIGDAHEE